MNKPMRSAGALMLAAALMGDRLSSVGTRTFPAAKSTRPCLYCGVMHQHNNCFCSAECCKNYNSGRIPLKKEASKFSW